MDSKQKALELFLEGLTSIEIGERLGIESSTIRAWANRPSPNSVPWKDLRDAKAKALQLPIDRETELCRRLILASIRRSLVAATETSELLSVRDLVGLIKIFTDLEGSSSESTPTSFEDSPSPCLETRHPFLSDPS